MRLDSPGTSGVRYLRERVRSRDDTDRPRCAFRFQVARIFLMSFAAIEAEKLAGDKTVQEVGQLVYHGALRQRLICSLQMIGLPASTPRGKPEDIASLVSYLAKPESNFLTGESFYLFLICTA